MTYVLTPEMETLLRREWPRSEMQLPDLCKALDCSEKTIKRVASVLELGLRPTAKPMWPDERVEELKRLYYAGYSASQIAAEMGGGLSRCAVLGKIHRGIPADELRKPASPPPSRTKAPTPPRPQKLTQPPGRRKSPPQPVAAPAPAAPARLSIAGTGTVFVTAPDTPDPVLKSRVWEPLPGTDPVPLLSAGAHMCRWPIGDPQSPDFGFCGRKAAETYCVDHAPIAFTPATTKRRVDDRLGIPTRRKAA